MRNDEPTGAPESLVGRIDPKTMGSRVQATAPKDLEKRKAKSKLTSADEVERSIRRAQEKSRAQFGTQGVLDTVAEMEGLRYRPRTAETREVYELLLGLTHTILGDQTQEVVRSAADTILESLKSEDLKEFDKRKDVESVLGQMDESIWAQLVSLGKKITDYVEEEEGGADERQQAVDQEGVAVLFEDEDEESEDDFEIGGNPSDEDEEEDEEDEEESGAEAAENEQDALVLGGKSSKRTATTDSDRVSPRDIDGFWLQRLIASYYPDPVQSSDFTSQALTLLSSDAELRDLENSLAEMFGYENFDLVAKLTKNRDVIVWCTKLARSNEDEKQDVEVAMREKGVGWILRELRGIAKKPDHVSTSVVIPKTATIQPGTIAQPRKTIDIDSLIFSEGGHLLTAKKVRLPEGSFKRQMKGYEEIHVPEPKRREPVVGELVPITKMPEWTWPVWESVKTRELNVIQSKVFPIAWGTNEPMLICAPTGAGKVSITFHCLVIEINLFRRPTVLP